MPSSYSPILKIELPSTGEQSGLWGVTTNTNLGTAIEEAITGRAAVSFSADSDLTISISEDNSSQAARHLILDVGSELDLTATRSLIVPDGPKQYIVKNGTTGDQYILVTTAAGAGVMVPNGAQVHLIADGTNVVAAQTHYVNPVMVGSRELSREISGSVLDLSLANYFIKTVTADTTLSVANVPPTGYVANIIVEVVNGGAHNVDWWLGVAWPEGIPPVLSISGRDVLGFFTRDGGTTWSSFLIAENML